MTLPFLVSFVPEPVAGNGHVANGLSLHQIAYFGRVLVKPSSVENALSFVRDNVSQVDVCADLTAIDTAGDVVDILNEGVLIAFITLSQLRALDSEQSVPAARLVVSLTSKDEVVELRNWIGTDSERKSIGVRYSDAGLLDASVLELKDNGLVSSVFRPYDSPTAQTGLLVNEQEGITTIVPAHTLSADQEDLSPAKLLASAAVPDTNTGLYATIVADERRVPLGFVWSSEKSIAEAIRTGNGVYQSRKRGLWYKGESSGDTQKLVRIELDCDSDCLVFVVRQKGRGFCHLGTSTCFGNYSGLSRLQRTLLSRKEDAPPGSYTARLFNDPKLVQAKIMEEAEELCEATKPDHIASEAADLIYFALTKCIASGVRLEDVERNLDLKNLKVKRRKGDAKPGWAEKVGLATTNGTNGVAKEEPQEPEVIDERIKMHCYYTATTPPKVLKDALHRPSQKSGESIVNLVRPIIQDVRDNGDAALLKYTHKFERATSLTVPVMRAPFAESLMQISPETKDAIDVSFNNIKCFHAAQKEENTLSVETMPGVVCSRFVRPIEKVGLYVPGGTAVLPSTTLMLGIPAMVAGCKSIVIASPPRQDGSISPEIVYIANKVGAESIVLAGGAQAIAAMAYGTESVTKVDKILGPGSQFVTAAKMLVSNDTSAAVAIDMPAGPSEVLVIADKHANPAFVASDLLSQAEHGVDSQVILIAIDLNQEQLEAIEHELHTQAMALPRVDIVRGAMQHSVTFVVKDVEEAFALSNEYAPEHLILQIENAEESVALVQDAGSVFIGPWTPESVGDYSAGVNHSLPTYGYAKQYSGVNLGSFVKHITSSNLTAQGLRNVSSAVMQLASVEGLDAHRRAVAIRIDAMDRAAS